VLVLTGHIGGWEIGAFAHSVYGYPMNIVVRDIDNPLVDKWARSQRERFCNRTVDGRKYARTYLHILREGSTLGVLMDTNVTPPRGVFAPFFGVPAYTGSAVAKLARHTDAAVIPGFTVWDEAIGKYKIIFKPALTLQKSENEDADVEANTAQFNRVYEDMIREYPDQWLWIHRRWKTRPAGEKPFYD
jgi:KDO2-lipid IV(A) lauroyltransferase